MVGLRSSLVIKNTDVGAGVIELDYRGNLKVVIMNRSVDAHLHTEPGDLITQFIMTRFKTPELEEVNVEVMEVLEVLVADVFFF